MTMHRTSLQSDTAWAMAGTMSQTAGQAAVMLSLAHVSTPHVVGQLALGLAIATPLNVFADRAIRMLQATSADDDFPLPDYLAVRTLAGLIALILTALIATTWQLGWWTSQIVMLVALTRAVEGVAQTLYGRMQREQCMRQIGQSQVVRSMLATVVSVTCLMVWQRLDLALATGLLANVVVVAVLDCARIERLRATALGGPSSGRLVLRWRSVPWNRLLRLGLPLAVSTFLVSLSVNLPRLLLSRSTSESSLGVFAVLCYACFPATMLVSAILQAATPRLARLYRDDPDAAYPRLVVRLLLIAVAIGTVNALAVHAFGRQLFANVLGAEYAAAGMPLDWIAAAAGIGFVASVPATAMNAQRMFRLSCVTCGLTCLITWLAGAWLIPRAALTGAAVTMVGSSSTHWLLSCLALRYAERVRRGHLEAHDDLAKREAAALLFFLLTFFANIPPRKLR